MSAFDRLSSPIREYIWDKKWASLRPIQEAAINQFYDTENNLLISAPTASGKTEAAFLPSMSKVSDWRDGVKIIYVSPLIALINDQFRRVEELSEYLDIPITSWHGEASQSAKKRLLKNPSGILLITPESIEAMLVRRPSEAKRLFGSVETVIIDEIHSFLGTTRGLHLQTLLYRIGLFTELPTRYIGLSATISPDSYSYAKSFFGTARETSILLDRKSNQREVLFNYIPGDAKTILLPPGLLDDLFAHTTHDRMLVFPNARSRVEELAVGLQRRSKAKRSPVRYFAHHASVNKELRLEAESFAKESMYELFTICCTSTLELGIDIGAVDSIAQVEAPQSVSSLAQRLGRGGRRTGVSKLIQYATSPWSLLQSLAAISLLEEGMLDPVASLEKQYSMLFQQILSLLLQFSGVKSSSLFSLVASLPPAADMTTGDIRLLLADMESKDYLEKSEDDTIVGLSAERITSNKGFYAHFLDKSDFTVFSDGRKVGELSHTPELIVGTNVFLAGKIWKVLDIDIGTKKIFVGHATDGKPPKFHGDGGNISGLLRQRMHDLLTGKKALPESVSTNKLVETAIHDLRQQTLLDSHVASSQRLIVADKVFYTFAGSRVNYTIFISLIARNAIKPVLDDNGESTIEYLGITQLMIDLQVNPITNEELKEYLLNTPTSRPPLTAKYMHYLSDELLIQELLAQYYSVEDANRYLEGIIF